MDASFCISETRPFETDENYFQNTITQYKECSPGTLVTEILSPRALAMELSPKTLTEKLHEIHPIPTIIQNTLLETVILDDELPELEDVSIEDFKNEVCKHLNNVVQSSPINAPDLSMMSPAAVQSTEVEILQDDDAADDDDNDSPPRNNQDVFLLLGLSLISVGISVLVKILPIFSGYPIYFK